MYHSKSYQSRPFTRFFHARYTVHKGMHLACKQFRKREASCHKGTRFQQQLLLGAKFKRRIGINLYLDFLSLFRSGKIHMVEDDTGILPSSVNTFFISGAKIAIFSKESHIIYAFLSNFFTIFLPCVCKGTGYTRLQAGNIRISFGCQEKGVYAGFLSHSYKKVAKLHVIRMKNVQFRTKTIRTEIERDILNQLKAWKESPRRKPLVLSGNPIAATST